MLYYGKQVAEVELWPKKSVISVGGRVQLTIPRCYIRSKEYALKLLENKIKTSKNVFH